MKIKECDRCLLYAHNPHIVCAASLMAAEYLGKSHIIWYDSDNPDSSLEQKVKKIVRSGEPVFLYRCGGKVQPPPKGYYWRMMQEHPS
ncbi:MAG: hypothetical protein ACYTXA_15380, partial [Nostoc sp.]